MSTNSRIGYLENGMVKSIYCHWDGYPSWNGIVLHECYSDVDKVKELVDRKGYISVLGSNVRNTKFGGHPQEDETILESLEDFKRDAIDFHYLFDTEAGGWTVFRQGREAKMADIVSEIAVFEGLEPGGGQQSFSRMQETREQLKNGYQTWDEPDSAHSKYLESYFVPQEKVVVILDGFTAHKYCEIPCSSLDEALEISDKIFGRSLEDIQNEFQPDIAGVISDAVVRAGEVLEDDGKSLPDYAKE